MPKAVNELGSAGVLVHVYFAVYVSDPGQIVHQIISDIGFYLARAGEGW